MNDWLLLVLLTLATYRITRFLVRDELPLIKAPRDAIANWLDPRDQDGDPVEPSPAGGFGRAVAYLIECPWCMSAWVAAWLVWVADSWVGLPVPVLMAAAVWGAAGLVAAAEARSDARDKLAAAQAADLAKRR